MPSSSPFTNQDAYRATELNRMRVRDALKLADRLQQDPQRAQRHARCMCATCFYAFRLAGQAFTPYSCKICEQQAMHPNTAVPKLCVPCAEEHGLCVQCGGYREDTGQLRPQDTQPLSPAPTAG